jgi:hypothetical protein
VAAVVVVVTACRRVWRLPLPVVSSAEAPSPLTTHTHTNAKHSPTAEQGASLADAGAPLRAGGRSATAVRGVAGPAPALPLPPLPPLLDAPPAEEHVAPRTYATTSLWSTCVLLRVLL